MQAALANDLPWSPSMVFSVERTSPNHNVRDIVDVTAMGKEVKYSYYLHFLYTRPVYQNYNLQKATNTNRGKIDGVCLVLATKDINIPLHACGSEKVGLHGVALIKQ